MSSLSSTAWQHVVQVSSRRRLLRLLSGGALSGLAPFALSELAGAGKKRKKHQRRKKRKNGQQPAPQVRADAACPPPQDDTFFVGPLARLAQSFTATTSGDLVKVELGIDNSFGSSSNYLVRLAPIIDALPGDAALATAQVATSALPAGITQAAFSFSAPARVVAGTSYALVLTIDGNDNLSWISRTGTACGGRGFLANGLSAPFEPRNELDFVYTTFVKA